MTTIRLIGDVSISHPLLDKAIPRLLAQGGPDAIVGNLEIPLTSGGWPAEKASVSRSDPANAAQYARLPVDVWTLATNHALDWGIEGLLDTIDNLDRAGVRHVGAGATLADARRPATLVARDGRRVAVLNAASTLPLSAAATTDRPGVAPLRVEQSYEFTAARLGGQPGSPPRVRTSADLCDVEELTDVIAAVKQDHDIVLVCLHWGVAWSAMPPDQGPLAEYQRPLAHRLVDAGADAVVGTHPHAIHPVEFYRDGVILYSLGNFLFHEKEGRIQPSVLHSGPWFESALFDLEISDGRKVVTLSPLRLNESGEPHLTAGRPGGLLQSLAGSINCASAWYGERLVLQARA